MSDRKSCIGCKYYRPLNAAHSRDKVCHYLIDTNIKRGCNAAECDKYECDGVMSPQQIKKQWVEGKNLRKD